MNTSASAAFGTMLGGGWVPAIRRSRRGAAEKSAALAAVAALAVIVLLGYGVWQSWWHAGLRLVAGVVAGAEIAGREQQGADPG